MTSVANFDTGDDATDHNLDRLAHLSRQEFYGDKRAMDGWIVAIIESIELLPCVARKHFSSIYWTHGAHYDDSDNRRRVLWLRLQSQLVADLQAASADETLLRSASPDFSDRPKTRAEAIEAICAELDEALSGGGDVARVAARLERAGVGTEVASDARQLKKLAERKRISDLDNHRYEMRRLLEHARTVGRQLHHLQPV